MSAGQIFIRESFDNERVKTDVFTSIEGRKFEVWVDDGSRDNGYDVNDLINNPAYLIESLLRDENFVERDLTISVRTDATHIVVNDLKSSEDNYYNGAIYFNATTIWKSLVTDYVGSTKTLVLDDADIGSAASDNVYLINVQGNNKIDYASFDLIGNTTNGTRKDWIFGRSFTKKTNIRDILDELCSDSHCELIESVNPDTGLVQFKLVAIDSGSGDTWTNPAYSGGLEQITASLTSLENIFTQFRLKYFYDYGKGDFIKEMYVDKNGFPTTATILSDSEKNLCKYAEQSYGVSRLFEYSSMNIYDDATAEYFLQKKINWFTKQRLLVNYISPIVGNADWIKYETGDQVKLNFSQGIPTGLNNSSMFMITNKTITPSIGGGYITWELIEL